MTTKHFCRFLLALLLLGTAVTHATPLIYEPFDYTPGLDLYGQTNSRSGAIWIKGSHTQDDSNTVVEASSLVMPGLRASQGNCIRLFDYGREATLPFGTTVTSNTLYYSTLIKIDDPSTFQFGLSIIGALASETNFPSSTGAFVSAGLVVTGSNNTYQVGTFKTNWTSSDFVYDSQLFSSNDTVLVVLAYTFHPGSDSNDVVRLWVQPNAATFGAPTAPAASVTLTNGLDQPDFESFAVLRNYGSAFLRMDEVRVGTSWAEVTPIPPDRENLDFGDAPTNYPTLFADNGARHKIAGQLFLGLSVDDEADGQPGINADGDDSAGPTNDENGVAFLDSLTPGGTAHVRVFVTGSGKLDAWLDFNQNGNWEPADQIFNSVPVVNGNNILSFSVPSGAALGNTYARFRLSSAGGLSPMGLAEDGEVEDYLVTLKQAEPQLFDYGDAPTNYPTLLADNGARHKVVGQLFLGLNVDQETDGQPTPAADGDDINGGPDDENGVTFLNPLTPGGMANLNVFVTGSGLLDAWIDWNQNGSWEPSEQIYASQAVVNGNNPLSFTVPPGALSGNTYARFRLSSAGGLLPGGLANDGEVEDYRVTIHQADPQQPVIAISKDVGPSSVITLLDAATFTLNYTNLGPGVATHCFITDTVPSGFAPMAVSSTPLVSYAVAGSTYTFDVGNLNPGNYGTIQFWGIADNSGLWTNTATMTSSNATPASSSVTFTVVHPDDPDFPTNPPPFNFSPCICGPLTGNYITNQIERWFVECDGGTLDFCLTARTVNTNDPQVTIADIYDGGTLLTTVTVTYSAAEAAAHGIGWETNQSTSIGPFPAGKKLRVDVRVGGTPETQTHYWLKFCGARWLAITSESFHSLEDDNASYRFVVRPAEALVIDINTNGIVAPAGVMDYRLVDPSGTIYSAGSLPISPADEFVIAAPMAGLWTLQLQPSPGSGEHYLLNKKSGADQHIYMDWHTSQRGRKVVEITLNGGPAMGTPFEVQMLRRRETAFGITNDLMATTIITNGHAEFDKLANGYYDVSVTPLVPGITNLPPQLDLILCDTPVTNHFAFHGSGGGKVNLDFGDAPAPYPTLLADNGARHESSQLHLGLLWDAEPDGQPSATAAGDNLAGMNDEDGVTFSPLIPGAAATANILASGPGMINAWIDFDRNGAWDVPEQILNNAPVVAGPNVLNFTVPPGLSAGSTFARVRLSTVMGLAPTGYAVDGEVEDYRVTIAPPPPLIAPLPVSGGKPAVNFLSKPGVRYRLQFKNNLHDKDWIDGPIVVGDGNALNLLDTNTPGTVRFYRLKME